MQRLVVGCAYKCTTQARGGTSLSEQNARAGRSACEIEVDAPEAAEQIDEGIQVDTSRQTLRNESKKEKDIMTILPCFAYNGLLNCFYQNSFNSTSSWSYRKKLI